MKDIAKLLAKDSDQLLSEWVRLQTERAKSHADISLDEMESQSADFLRVFSKAVSSGEADINDAVWDETLALLREIALYRAQRGQTPRDSAMFILSLKEVLFERILEGKATAKLLPQLWEATLCVDEMGLYVMSTFIEKREDVIERQQEEMLEISLPVVELWEGILALPVIGTLDSARAQAVMEGLLQAIVEHESKIAIIDITGVPAVDTQTAQHLLKTVTAAELMGARCLVSGIKPQIAQTIVQLGLDLGEIQTKGSLMSAFQYALTELGMGIAEK